MFTNVLNRLTKWSIEHEEIIPNEIRFQKGKSTTDYISLLHSLIMQSTNSNKNCFVPL